MIRSSFLLWVACLALGCRQVAFREPVTRYKHGQIVTSNRITAKESMAKEVKLRSDLNGMNPDVHLDQSLNRHLAEHYERDIATYQVEPEIKKSDKKVFSTSPEDDAPLQIFLKPVQ